MKASSFSVVIPIYNEEEILENQVKRLTEAIEHVLPQVEYEIVLVENGSIDSTFKIAEKLSKENNNISLIKLTSSSYGQAFKEGIRQAKYDIVFQFDIDFWDIDFIDLSLLLLSRYEMVIGSKNLSTSTDKRPVLRRITSKALEIFLKLYFNVPYSDTHGMKALKKNLILPLIDEVKSPNHFFDSELLIMSHYLGYTFKELPVSLEEIRSTRFSFLIRVGETLQEFIKLISIKKFLVKYAYI